MAQKKKLLFGGVLFLMLLLGAGAAYDALSGSVSPEIILAEQPEGISGKQGDEAEDMPQADGGAANEAAINDADVNVPENADSAPERIKAPDFAAVDSADNSVRLSDMEGKPVVLNFWASWCPPCKAEMPDFETVYSEMGEDVTFMMVNMTDGQRETKEKGAEYIAEQGYSFPVYYDTEQEAAYGYGIRSIPTTVFIDSEGYVVTGAEGAIDEKTLRYGISLIQGGD